MMSLHNYRILCLSLILFNMTFTQLYATKAVKVYSKETGLAETNVSKPSFYVENTGDITISSYIVYYYFTTENAKTPVLEDWYTPNSTLILEDLGNGNYRVKFDYDNVNLAPGQEITLNGNSWGLHFSDWLDWDKSNDYSSNLSSNFAENQKIVVYEQGEQDPLYGTLPEDDNSVPIAENVYILGDAISGNVLSGEYDYHDEDDDLEGQSLYKWYRADDPTGTNAQIITGQTNQTYTVVNDDIDKYICFEVTPVAQTGSSPGQAVYSIYLGPVEENGGGAVYLFPADVDISGEDMKVEGKSLFTDNVLINNDSDPNEKTTLNTNGINISDGWQSTSRSTSITSESLYIRNILDWVSIAPGNVYLSSTYGNKKISLNSDGMTIEHPSGTTKIEGPTVTAEKFKVGKWIIESPPDYVFAKDYNLRSLKDLERYVKKHNHLPDIPDAREIREEGIDLVTMNMLLLSKVEELTLYTIEQEKKIERLEKLEKEIEKIKSEIKK